MIRSIRISRYLSSLRNMRTYEVVLTQETMSRVGSAGVVEDFKLVMRGNDLGTSLSKTSGCALDDRLHVCAQRYMSGALGLTIFASHTRLQSGEHKDADIAGNFLHKRALRKQ